MSLEETLHDAIPNGIGGDFSLFTAPSGKFTEKKTVKNAANTFADPVWFVYYAQIDRLFWRWQNNEPAKHKSIDGLVETGEEVRGSIEAPMRMLGLAPDLPASAVLNTESGMLCYTYI